MGKQILAIVAFALTVLLSGCGYNDLQSTDEQIKAAWAEVLNQYQRRVDLIPSLVETVKGFAAQEQQVLLGVTQARSRVGSIQATPELVNDPQAFARFQEAQGALSSALSRLLLVAENYPQLKSDQNFRDLQARLVVRQFPSNLTAMLFGFKEKPQFTVENEKEIGKPPKVDFGKPAPAEK